MWLVDRILVAHLGKNECALCLGRAGIWWMRRVGYVRDCCMSSKMVLFSQDPQIDYDWILTKRTVAFKHFSSQFDKVEHYNLGSHLLKERSHKTEKATVTNSPPEKKEPPINWKFCFGFFLLLKNKLLACFSHLFIVTTFICFKSDRCILRSSTQV